jgi:hypothetical protein
MSLDFDEPTLRAFVRELHERFRLVLAARGLERLLADLPPEYDAPVANGGRNGAT